MLHLFGVIINVWVTQQERMIYDKGSVNGDRFCAFLNEICKNQKIKLIIFFAEADNWKIHKANNPLKSAFFAEAKLKKV